METSVFSFLAIAAFGLLGVVTVGVLYLTIVEWRDRRRQDQDKRIPQERSKRAR